MAKKEATLSIEPTAAPTTPKTAFKTGAAALPASKGDGSGIEYVKLEENVAIEIIPMVGMDKLVSINQHAFWRDAGGSPVFTCIKDTGQECPGCVMKGDRKYKAFLPVIFRNKEGQTVAGVLPAGVSIIKQLAEIEAMREASIAGKPIKIKRTGSKMSTRYAVVATEKPVYGAEVLGKYEMPNIEAALGPMTTEGIIKLLEAKDFPYPPAGMKVRPTKDTTLIDDDSDVPLDDNDWEGL